jgi:hypothetical protein
MTAGKLLVQEALSYYYCMRPYRLLMYEALSCQVWGTRACRMIAGKLLVQSCQVWGP